jgi:hypothetical protein
MDLRNSIMEEVILKNYKLLQFVENEMKQLNDKIAILNEENANLKEENKLTHAKIETLQTKIDNSGIESNILVGYTGANNPVYCNYNFNKEYKHLPMFLQLCNCKILLKLSVFKQLSTYYNFNDFDLQDLCTNTSPYTDWIPKINFVDGNDITDLYQISNCQPTELEQGAHKQKLKISTPKPIIITSYFVHNGQANDVTKYIFPLLDKLINVLNSCGIKLTLNRRFVLYLDNTNKINYRRIDNSTINNFRGMNNLLLGNISCSSTYIVNIEQ